MKSDAMKWFKASLILAAIVFSPALLFGQAREQTIFPYCGVGTIKNKATISPDVLKTLLATDQVGDYFDYAKDDPKADLRGFFQAAEVHLADPETVDLVVVGNPPLSGADNCWYWIVRSARKDPHVILFGTGSSLEVMSEKTNGYKDIQTHWESAGGDGTYTSIYQYNGTAYRLWKNLHEQNPKQ
jgi:hypothetical protein